MNTEEFLEELSEVNGVKIRITSYKIGDEFHCHISNVDPGATIARVRALTKQEAVEEAMRKVSERILLNGKSI